MTRRRLLCGVRPRIRLHAFALGLLLRLGSFCPPRHPYNPHTPPAPRPPFEDTPPVGWVEAQSAEQEVVLYGHGTRVYCVLYSSACRHYGILTETAVRLLGLHSFRQWRCFGFQRRPPIGGLLLQLPKPLGPFCTLPFVHPYANAQASLQR